MEVILTEWYVLYSDSNARKIVKWNIFNHETFKREVDQLLKENLTKDDFSEKLGRLLMYYMWFKSEYEIIVSPWVGRAEDIKIDVYSQVHMNWDRFVDYVWSFR